jgi:hypothetical protein
MGDVNSCTLQRSRRWRTDTQLEGRSAPALPAMVLPRAAFLLRSGPARLVAATFPTHIISSGSRAGCYRLVGCSPDLRLFRVFRSSAPNFPTDPPNLNAFRIRKDSRTWLTYEVVPLPLSPPPRNLFLLCGIPSSSMHPTAREQRGDR